MRLKCSNRIRRFRVLYSPQENTTPSAIIIVKVELGVEAEMQEICLSKGEDVASIGPGGDWIRNRMIEAGD